MGAVLAAVVFAAWMLWPRPLAGEFNAADGFSAVVIVRSVEIDGFQSHPTSEIREVSAGADSPKSAAVQAVLERYSYRLCLDTLTGKSGLEDIGETSVGLYGDAGSSLSVFSGTGKLLCNDRIVRVGCWGSKDAAALCRELLAALEAE